ncbi:MAG: NAD-dependent epimerase/dehydratase family protein, partial [Paracoccus sp. (in: a-proteobacteria)]
YNRQYGTDYRSVMPCNLYGPGDNFDPENSHVMPALIRRFHEARRDGKSEVVMWGTGAPRREFLHVDDMARASLFVFDLDRAAYEAQTEPMLSHLNVGGGSDIAIGELAAMVARIVGYEGRITNDLTRPDGTMRKLMSSDKLMAMGWRPQIALEEGIADAYRWFIDHRAS